MRLAPVCAFGLLLLIPSNALARKDCRVIAGEERCKVTDDRNECQVLSRQIAHFTGVVELAQERDNELWENATQEHIVRLESRRKRLCNEPEPDGTLEVVADLIGKAASIAARAFTAGLF